MKIKTKEINVKSAYESSGAWGRRLSPVSVVWREYEYFYSHLDGMQVHRRVPPPPLNSSVSIYTLGWRETLWELCFAKNSTQGLEPGPVTGALTTRKPLCKTTWTARYSTMQPLKQQSRQLHKDISVRPSIILFIIWTLLLSHSQTRKQQQKKTSDWLISLHVFLHVKISDFSQWQKFL